MRRSICLAALAVLAPPGLALAGVPDCTSGSCSVTPDAATWAQVAKGVQAGGVAYPRNAQGAVLQRVNLTTQEPVSDSEETLCDGRQEATARYRWRSRSVTFSNVTAAGTDCTTGDPLRFRCTTTTITGLGRTRDCTSSTWRIITWGGYVLGVGGRYEISGPRSFPVVAMARSVR